jgi:sugar transferase (PEP-CTERM/EpsH1 system associated)
MSASLSPQRRAPPARPARSDGIDGARPLVAVHHVVLSLQPGGLENGVVNVVNRLDHRRFASTICCLKEAGEFARRIEDPRVEVHALGWPGGTDLALPIRLARLFRRTRARIVHTRNAEAFFYGVVAAKLAGVPAIVHSEHGRSFDDRPLRLAAQRWMTRFTSAVFTVSEQLKSDLVRFTAIPSAAIDVLHNGVDVDRFGARDPQARQARRAAWGVGGDDLVIGAVGRLAPVKNHALLLRAVAATRSPAHVVLVGDGPERGSLQALADSLGIAALVRCPGHSDDVGSDLAAFDVFALPSRNEGMSNTLLEAMAASLPVVVSDVGGNLEIVRDGVDGLSFANGDERALVQCLDRLGADPALRARLGGAGRDRVAASFSIRAMVERYETLYDRVLASAV